MALARRQGGVISRSQLRLVGVSERQTDGLARTGAIRPLGFGVWQVAGAPASREAALWRAVLMTRGILVAGSAAFVWRCLDELIAPIQVAVRRPLHNRVPRDVRVHRWELDPSTLASRAGLPVTTRAVAVVDHVAQLHWPAAMGYADRALSQGWMSALDVQRRLLTKRPGNSVLRKVLATHSVGAEAESERRLHRLLAQAGITGWVPNYRVLAAGQVIARVDVAFPGQKLAIEVDGFAYHSDRSRFQRDRSRQNDLVRRGWTVLRFTWFDLVERPDHVVAVIAAQLQRMVS